MALCRGSGGHCAPSRQAAEPTSLERDPGRGSDAEPRQRKGQFCPGRLAPSSRRSIPPRQSPFARHEPVCDRRRSDERPPGRTAGGRGWCPRFSRRSLCPIQISLSKHQRPRALRPASSPRCACGFRPGGERRQTPTMARPGRVMRRASQCREEAPRCTPSDLTASCSAPVATRPRSSACAPSA